MQMQQPSRRFQMVLSASVIGGLLLLAYCVSRVKAKRAAKKSIETLFYTK
jgi:outer membrane murein-binding lipoprotein Lpp